MAMKVTLLLCLIGLTRAGNLYDGSVHGYSSGTGTAGLTYATSLGQGSGLGYGTSLGYGSDVGYLTSLGHSSGLGYDANFGHGVNVGYGAGFRYANGYESHGYGTNAAYIRPSVSSVSIVRAHAPTVASYSSGHVALGAFASGIAHGGQAYDGGHNGYGYVYGGYGNKW